MSIADSDIEEIERFFHYMGFGGSILMFINFFPLRTITLRSHDPQLSCVIVMVFPKSSRFSQWL